MTKTEFLNDLIYDMAGYLDTSGVDRLKMRSHTDLKGSSLHQTKHYRLQTFGTTSGFLADTMLILLLLAGKRKRLKCTCIH